MENSIEGEFYNLAALEGWRGVDVDVIADIKQVAIDEHRAAWDVMEQAAREFLRRRKPMKKET